MSVAGWVLVGGQSTRMGLDKAALDWNGEPLALSIAQKVRAAAGSVMLAGAPGRYEEWGIPTVADRDAGLGPLAGLVAILSATRADWNLVVACDLPRLNTELLESLVAAVDATATDIDAIVPRHPNGRLEPLCAVYHRRALPHAESAVAAGDLKVLNLLKKLKIQPWAITDPTLFANVNTPTEWAAAGGTR